MNIYPDTNITRGTAKREIISSSISEIVTHDSAWAWLKYQVVCISMTPNTTKPRNNRGKLIALYIFFLSSRVIVLLLNLQSNSD